MSKPPPPPLLLLLLLLLLLPPHLLPQPRHLYPFLDGLKCPLYTINRWGQTPSSTIVELVLVQEDLIDFVLDL